MFGEQDLVCPTWSLIEINKVKFFKRVFGIVHDGNYLNGVCQKVDKRGVKNVIPLGTAKV